MATILTYNTIELDDILTVDFKQAPHFTDDKTTHLWDDFNIRVKAYFNLDLLPSTGSETPEAIYNRVRTCLTAKGKALQFQSSGTNIINLTSVDAIGGPTPVSLNIRRITTATWEIEYEVSCSIAACCGGTAPTALLSNRWQDSVSIDANQYTTWSRKGKLYFRYDALASANTKPDEFRQYILAACPLKPGFIRTKLSFTVSSDWLHVDYDIEDKEVYAMPVKLATGGAITEWSGSYKANSKAGGILEEELSIELKGTKEANKAEMYQKAAAMANTILGIQDYATSKPKRMLMGAAFAHELHENTVSLTLKSKGSPRKTTLGGYSVPVALVTRVANNVTGQDRDIPDPGSRGTARLKNLANILADPCIAQGDVQNGQNGWTPQVPGKTTDVT